VDGRKGADSLMVLVRDVLLHDALSGHLYVFFSRRRDRVRIVYWDRNGFAMWSKHLQRGRFQLGLGGDGPLAVRSIEAAQLALILEGIDLAGAHHRPRWQPARSNSSDPKKINAMLNP
jgi:transposase